MRSAGIIAAAGVLAMGIGDRALGQTMFGASNQGGSAATRTPTASAGARTSTGSSVGGSSGGATSGGGSGGSTVTPINTTNVAQLAQQNMVTASAQRTQQAGAFVGADSSDTTNVRSLQALQGGTQQRNNASGLNQLQNLFSQGLQQLNQQNQRAARPKIRTPLRMGFQPQPVSMTHVRKFEEHLTKLPGLHFVGTPEVTLEGRTAVLRGTVASEDDRRLAEALARMDPEVLAVRNELKVDSAAKSAAEELPANQP